MVSQPYLIPHVAAYLAGRVHRAVPPDQNRQTAFRQCMRLRHDGFRDCPEERSARLYRGSRPIGPPWDAAFAETVAAFLASHQSWHEQPQSLHLAIPQKGPLWSWCFEDKKSPRSIDRGRGAQERETQHRCGSWNETLPRLRTPRRHCVKAQELALSLGALARLAQDEEPGSGGGEAGSGGGLGLPGARDSGGDGGTVRIAL